MVEEYDNYEYEDAEIEAEEEAEQQYEDSADMQQDYMDDISAPSMRNKDDLYSLFWKVIRIKDSSKVGNLSKEELGLLPIPVREAQRIRLLGYLLNHPVFGNFYGNEAEITLATSSSKEGWLPQLFVRSEKISTKRRSYNTQNLVSQQPQQKRSLFKWGR